MKGTFGDGLDRIKHSVGSGSLKGSVEVDQVYAHYQHAGDDFYHPDGGKAYYLRDPLFAGAEDAMEKLAGGVITESGESEVKERMIDVVEKLVVDSAAETPVEFDDLRRSGHPTVEDDGATFYDRAPLVGRLSEEDLKLKGKISRAVEPDRYKR